MTRDTVLEEIARKYGLVNHLRDENLQWKEYPREDDMAALRLAYAEGEKASESKVGESWGMICEELGIPATSSSMQICDEIATVKSRVSRLEGALRSIANNTCCVTCQEAALVARAALEEKQ